MIGTENSGLPEKVGNNKRQLKILLEQANGLGGLPYVEPDKAVVIFDLRRQINEENNNLGQVSTEEDKQDLEIVQGMNIELGKLGYSTFEERMSKNDKAILFHYLIRLLHSQRRRKLYEKQVKASTSNPMDAHSVIAALRETDTGFSFKEELVIRNQIDEIVRKYKTSSPLSE